MDRDTAKQIAKSYLKDFLQDEGIFIGRPFRCLSPDHTDSHPSMSYDPKREKVHCFGCGADYDIFDLIGIKYGLTEAKDIFTKTYELYNIDVDNPSKSLKKEPVKSQKAPEDYTIYYEACKIAYPNSPASAYMQGRGISDTTAAAFGIGYDSNYPTFNEGADGVSSWARWQSVIIPTGNGSYISRNVDPEASKQNRYRKKGPSLIFNSMALYQDRPVFVVEGEIDAISIIEAGGSAIGLGSTSNVPKLLSMVKKQKPTQPLILSLDNDEEGKKAEDRLAAELEENKILFYRHNVANGFKDANDSLVNNRKGFIDEIKAAEGIKEAAERAEIEAQRDAYFRTSAAAHMSDFENGVSESANTPVTSTGFLAFDRLLDGGLYPGLYFIGAISSLGKTTLALQIMDNIAKGGTDVLVFSLEMARSELMAKSISRITYIRAEDKADAKTTRGILSGAKYKNYPESAISLINKAKNEYMEYAGRIFIHEGIGNIGVEQIRETIRQHIAVTGNRPIVLIDYVQILAPYDMRATDKQNTDKAVLELKRASRDFKTSIIGISSFNRENYAAPVNLSAFKESGAIEYSADVLIGLQYAGLDYQENEKKEERERRVRSLVKRLEDVMRRGMPITVQLKVLKNRNGKKGSIYLEFNPKFNYFKDVECGFEEAPADVMKTFAGCPVK